MATEEEELIIYRRSMRIPYRWAAGMTATRFYREIAQGQKIFGTKCAACGRVLMPARKSCSLCFKDTNEWVEVGPEGTIKTFTVVRYPVPFKQPAAADNANSTAVSTPLIYALIQLDGADTAFIHMLGETAVEAVQSGLRVKAVFAEQPNGNILDIAYFKPIS